MNKSERDRLILDNQRLVYYFYERLKKSPLIERNKEDLISEGMLGLVKAAQCFEPDKGCKFATFARRCITNQMLMFIRKLNKQNCEVSLYAPIGYDKEGNEMMLEDVLADDGKDIDNCIYRMDLDVFGNSQSPRAKNVLNLYLQGHTQREIATAEGISQSYVLRIIKRLKEKMSQ